MSSDLWKLYSKVNSTLTGRDSVFRLVQYASHLSTALLEESNAEEQFVEKSKNVEQSFSLARKFLRLFRVFEVLNKALQSLSYHDPVIKFTTGFSHVNTALYYLTDHVVWLSKAGIHQTDLKKWSILNNKFWLVSVIMNLCRILYELRIGMISDTVLSVKAVNKNAASSFVLQKIFKSIDQKMLIINLLKNLCDLSMALTFLGRLKLNNKTVGILGVISSIIAMLSVLNTRF